MFAVGSLFFLLDPSSDWEVGNNQEDAHSEGSVLCLILLPAHASPRYVKVACHTTSGPAINYNNDVHCTTLLPNDSFSVQTVSAPSSPRSSVVSRRKRSLQCPGPHKHRRATRLHPSLKVALQ